MSDISGMLEFIEDMEKYSRNASDDKIAEVLMAGADELAEDVRKLPKPRTAMGGGHTHMLDSVGTKKNGAAVQVGWGQFYGAFVERGTRKQRAQPHISKTWDQNKDRYYKTMSNKLLQEV